VAAPDKARNYRFKNGCDVTEALMIKKLPAWIDFGRKVYKEASF